MSNLLFFDLDGTIVDAVSGTIPASTKEVLKLAKKKGNKLFVNTGRPLSALSDELKDPEIFDGIICGLGTNIFYNGEELLHHTLGVEESTRIMNHAMSCNVEAVFESKNRLYMLEDYEFPHFKEVLEYYTRNGFTCATYPCADMVFDKFVVSSINTDKFDSFIDGIPNLDVIDRGHDFYEMVPKGYSKATGIDFICNYLGESLDDCYAFGDSTNDLPMLTHVPHSVAMGNGTPLIFDKCEFVTTTMEENGILNAFKHYGLID